MPRPSSSTPADKPKRRYAPRMAPEQRREHLLDAALRVTVDEGYAGVSIEAIARAAGVTRPVIYDHFPNLGKLIQALVAREESYAVQQLTEALATPAPPHRSELPEMLSGIVHRFLEAVMSRPDTWRLILLSTDGMPPIVRAHVESNLQGYLVRLEALIAAASEGSRFGPELDVELAARAMLGFAWEAGRLVLTDPDAFTPDRFESFLAALVAGVSQRAA